MDLSSTLDAPNPAPDLYPQVCEPLEEVGAARPVDASAALAFALSRLASDDPRPWVMATTPMWLRERGRPFARGLAGMGAALDLSAARMRWRIATAASAPILIDGALFDEASPGPPRLVAELVRRRSGPPGIWELEQDDETGGFRVVAGLADHGLAAAGSERGKTAAA